MAVTKADKALELEQLEKAFKGSDSAIIVDYKGLTRYRDTVVEYLAPFDDGAPTSPGTAPE